jgi:outer membrane lipoprotein carrier protein
MQLSGVPWHTDYPMPRAVLALALTLALGSSSAPAASPAADALAGLQAWLDGTRTLEARFEQSLVSGALGAGLTERGRVYVERPGRLRFDYVAPEHKVAIVDGGRTWLYLAAERQLLLGRLESEADLLPVLLAGSKPLAEVFEASVENGRLVLVPRQASNDVGRIVVTLRAPSFAIESADVLDAAGNHMQYAFSGMQRNAGLPRGVFAFEPPRGTEVSGTHGG